MPETYGFSSTAGQTVYEVDYYAGSQVLVYFEDVLVDDAIRIAWSVRQERFPVYGYASQYFNALGSGPILGGGSLWIGFKEAAYVPLILRHISERRDPNSSFYASPALAPESGASLGTDLVESSSTWQGATGGTGLASRAEIERLMQLNREDPDDADIQRQLAALTTQLGALDDRAFEDAAEVFEDALWYGGNSVQDGRGDAMSGNFSGGELEDDAFLALRRADQFPPFDIIVTFGDINNRAANHTLHRLTDVTITNTEFAGIEPTGEPVIARFDFLCRNVM